MSEGNIRPLRLKAVIVLSFISMLALSVRIGYLQIVKHDEYARIAVQEHDSEHPILPHRGAIRDRSGYPLAITLKFYDVYLDSQVLRNPGSAEKIDRTLSPLLSLPSGQVAAIRPQKGMERTLLKQGVSFEIGQKLSALNLHGIELVEAPHRVYPEGSLAASLVGFVGKDQKGLTGVEADYNNELFGKAGKIIFERDSYGNEIPLGFRESAPAQEGADLFLTVDRFIQRLIENELDQSIKDHQASGGTIIAMDPKTGAILGMASRPSFDLTRLELQDPSRMSLFRNRAITDMYEPGSIFKIVTMASALEEKKVAPTTTFYDSGVVVKYGWPIRNWDGVANGVQTMTELLMKSINVGAVWVSDLLGPQTFYKYVVNFGFGERTNIDLSGEAPGQVRLPQDAGWSPVDLATNSFGQGINVTPLQMITAISAVANGGHLMRPYVVERIAGPRGTRVFQPVVMRQVISPETARTLTGMLTSVVEEGLTKLAVVRGYRVAGKTGTAQMVFDGGYSGSSIASFVGYGPAEDPQIIVLIKIDSPKDTPWGSVVASPIFRSLAQKIFPYMEIVPSSSAESRRVN
ncbi:MAG: penicillin-binding protein 2 [Chloroflexi bacterium]|nr:penicillin-binding protein 2 [Chloroflexota bacterium]